MPSYLLIAQRIEGRVVGAQAEGQVIADAAGEETLGPHPQRERLQRTGAGRAVLGMERPMRDHAFRVLGGRKARGRQHLGQRLAGELQVAVGLPAAIDLTHDRDALGHLAAQEFGRPVAQFGQRRDIRAATATAAARGQQQGRRGHCESRAGAAPGSRSMQFTLDLAHPASSCAHSARHLRVMEQMR